MAYLELDGGGSIYYEHHRGSSGPPVLLIHGWGASSRCWDAVLAALLVRSHEVVTYDQRCCGRSDKDFGDVSIATQAGDVVKLVAATGLVKPVLNGWSFGGPIAVQAASLATFEHSAHMPFLEQAGRYQQELLRFLDDLSSP